VTPYLILPLIRKLSKVFAEFGPPNLIEYEAADRAVNRNRMPRTPKSSIFNQVTIYSPFVPLVKPQQERQMVRKGERVCGDRGRIGPVHVGATGGRPNVGACHAPLRGVEI